MDSLFGLIFITASRFLCPIARHFVALGSQNVIESVRSSDRRAQDCSELGEYRANDVPDGTLGVYVQPPIQRGMETGLFQQLVEFE
jgi:hypothetical protein